MNEIAERVFFCTNDGAHKFWRVAVQNETQTVCWGRIGTTGQVLTRTFGDFDEAETATTALIAKKRTKGYVEVSREEANAVVPVPVQRAAKVVGAFQMLLTFDEEAKAADDALLGGPRFLASPPPIVPAALSLF